MRSAIQVVVSMLGLLAAASAGAERVEHIVDWAPRQFPLRGAGEIDVRGSGARIKVLAGSEGRILVRGSIRSTARDPDAAKVGSHASNITATAEGDRVTIELDG